MDDTPDFGLLLDHAQDKIVLLDETGRFTYANAAVERSLGWDPTAIVGENAFDYVHPDDLPTVKSAFEETITSDGFAETSVEYRLRAADGAWHWFESRVSNLSDEELGGYVVSSREITDLVAARREREQTARQLEAIAGAASDVLWLFDGDWSELLFVNPAYESVYGQPVETVEGDPQRFLDTIHPDDVPAVEAAMERLSAGESVDMEYRVDPATEYGTWVWVQAEPIIQDDEVVRIAGFSRDVSDRHRRTRQLYVMDNLLRHNLRNDINVILGSADRIEQGDGPTEELTALIRKTGEELLASADKQRQIIQILSDEPAATGLDLTEVVETATETVRERFPEVCVETRLPAAADVTALEELPLAVIELLENAIRHSPPTDPTVSVEVTVDDEIASVAVTNEGPAIPEAEASVLTGGVDMTAVYHSTGLGLWLVYWIVELSDGHVDVTRTESGNRVVIVLPRSRN